MMEAGRFIVRLAETDSELAAAQALRYRVFVEELGAVPSAESRAARREIDAFDPYCDHLLLIDRSRMDAGLDQATIGVYRLLTGEKAVSAGIGFYSAGEFDLAPILDHPGGQILELGRSCVDKAYRGGSAMQILWIALSKYVVEHKVSLMFGCASFHGVDLNALAQPLSFLHHRRMAPEGLRPRALPQFYESMNLLPDDQIDAVAAMRATPALIKGYLRLGGKIGDGAYIDRAFNTIDVCVVLPAAPVIKRFETVYARKSPMALERLLG